MKLGQNLGAQADEIRDQRIGKRTVHVAHALKIQNDLFVRMHERINLPITEGCRFFAIRQEIPELGCELNVQSHANQASSRNQRAGVGDLALANGPDL